MKNDTLPKLIKTVDVPHPARFSSGPRVCKIQFISLGECIVAVEFWHHENGTLCRVSQRELRDGERDSITASNP